MGGVGAHLSLASSVTGGTVLLLESVVTAEPKHES